MKNIPDANRTIHAVNLLNHSCLLWWESLGHPDICDYSIFIAAFKKAYMPEGFIKQVRGQLLSAKLTSTLSKFLTRLRLYMNILLAEDPSGRSFLESTATTIFIRGCPEDLQLHLQSELVINPSIPFYDLYAKAEAFDALFSYGPKGATK
ncbi:hypothetical protein FBU30_002951, partial [Linnemannia zychae]